MAVRAAFCLSCSTESARACDWRSVTPVAAPCWRQRGHMGTKRDSPHLLPAEQGREGLECRVINSGQSTLALGLPAAQEWPHVTLSAYSQALWGSVIA